MNETTLIPRKCHWAVLGMWRLTEGVSRVGWVFLYLFLKKICLFVSASILVERVMDDI